MKKVFNKSAAYGLVFAISSFWLGYVLFLIKPISEITPKVAENIEFVIINWGFATHFAIISIPIYFLLRRLTENKLYYALSSLSASLLIEIPLYIFREHIGPDGKYVGNLGMAIFLCWLIAATAAILLISIIDIIICIKSQRHSQKNN